MAILLAFIITILPSGGKMLTAEQGKAIRHKGETGPSTITMVAIPANADPNDWEDCDYGEPETEAEIPSQA